MTRNQYAAPALTDAQRLEAISEAIHEIFGCQGWTEALTEPGSVADWMGPRLYRIKDLSERVA
jgi:hypothetical protein